MGKFIDYSGQRFGRLTVIERTGTKIRGKVKCVKTPVWRCLCDCGNECFHTSAELRSGDAKSCGCLARDTLVQRSTTHGDAHDGAKYNRLYKIWFNMKRRCESPDSNSYKNYGGRGIDLCKEWHDYPTFKQWALSNGYDDDLTIDRIDNKSGYHPDNCRWTDMVTQANNRRSCRYITIDGIRKTITEWCKIYGINPFTVYSRIDDFGWNPEDAIKTPPRSEKPVIMMDENGNEIKRFESANVAAEELYLNPNKIRSACLGNQKTYNNYHWKYDLG